MSFVINSFPISPTEHGPVVMRHKGWQSSNKSKTAELSDDADREPRKREETRNVLPPPKLQFVNTTDPTQKQDAKTRKLIKTHVVKDLLRQKRVLGRLHANPRTKASRISSLSSIPETVSTSTSDKTPSQPTIALFQSLDPHPNLSATIHYINKVASAMYPLESKFKFNPLSAAPWFDFALSDEALFNALLYTTTAYAGLIQGTAESKVAMVKMNRSVVLVNERLKREGVWIEDGTIGAVSCLGITEALRGNVQGWNMHMAGLKQLVEMRGGISALNTTLQLKLLRADLVGAVDFFTHPHFQFHRSTKSKQEQPLISSDLEHAENITAIMINAKVCSELIAIFTCLIQFTYSCKEILRLPSTLPEKVSFIEDVYSLRYTLVSLNFPHQSNQSSLNEALRIGALIFIKETLQEFPVSAIGSEKMVRRLKESILGIDYEGEGLQLNISLWLLVMGAISSRRNEDRKWFVEKLRGLLDKWGVTGWGSAKRVLESLLWIEEIHDISGEKLWEEATTSKTVY